MKINKILISQPKPASDKSPYFDLADRYGVELVFRPFIKVEGLSAKEFRAQKISIPEHTAIIFTAKTAIDNFFRLCEEMRISVPESQKYFCTSELIANYLQKYIVYRKRKIFAAKTGKMADLIPLILKHKNEKYLYAVSDVNGGTDTEILQKNNIDVSRAVMYRTVSNDFAPDEPRDYDLLAIFSPAGVESMLKNFPDFNQDDMVIATFGAQTTAAAKAAGLRVDIDAPNPNAPSMAVAIEQYLAEHAKPAKAKAS